MLQLDISDESIAALWCGLRRELDALVAPKLVSQAFLEVSCAGFGREGFGRTP